MLVPIVNERDEVIGTKERSELGPGDIHRVAVLWITNSADQLLLGKRSLQKKKNGGKWGAIGGYVEEGEEYQTNIIKEAKEELGLDIDPAQLQLGPKWRSNEPPSNHFAQSFVYRVDRRAEGFAVDPAELELVAWLSKEELRAMIKDNPDQFSASALKGISLLLK